MSGRIVSPDEAREYLRSVLAANPGSRNLAHTVVVLAEQIAAVRLAVRDHESCKNRPCQVCAALGVTA